MIKRLIKYTVLLFLFPTYQISKAQPGDPCQKQILYLIEQCKKVNNDDRIKLAEQGIRLASKCPNDTMMAKFYFVQAEEYNQKGQIDKAWSLFQQSRLYNLKARSYTNLAKTIYQQGRILLIDGYADSVIRFMEYNKLFIERCPDVSIRMSCGTIVANANKNLGNYDLARELLEDLIRKALTYNDTSVYVSSCLNITSIQNSTDSALYWAHRAMTMVNSSSHYYPEVLMRIAYIYFGEEGARRDSILYYIKLAEKHKSLFRNPAYANDLYNILGSYLYSRSEYRLAMNAFIQAVGYYPHEGKRSNLIYNNMALCMINLRKNDSAEYYLQKFERVLKTLGGDDYEKLLYHQTRSELLATKEDTCSAGVLNENLTALSYAAKLGDTRLGSELLFKLLGCISNPAKTPNVSDKFSKEVLAYCRDFYIRLKREEKLMVFSRYVSLYAKTEARFGDKDKALRFFDEYQETIDRMFDENYIGDMHSALAKYKADLKDQEIALLNQKEQQSITRTIFIAIALVLVTLVLVLIYVLYKREAKSKRRLDERNQKVEQLLREVHHRVKNNLQIVSSFISIQMDKVKDAVSAEALKDTSTRIMALAGLHQSIYRQDDLSRIQLKEYLSELCESLNASINHDVKITYDLDALNLDIDQAIPIGLAVNELITNALKHAFTGKTKGQIEVMLKRKTKWELVVKDNGKGLPPKLRPEELESIGMRLVQDLAERQLKGSLSYYNDGGAVFKIEFMPVAA